MSQPTRPGDPLPLSDIVVLDLTIARAGPTAVRQLADWGADAVRIEAPNASFEANESADQPNPDALNIHRNKRSIVIDLTQPAGRDLLHRMVSQADVLIENMRPPVKSKLGFDWPTLSAINPALVMGSISGFGQTGPYAERGGVDQIAQGMGGLMAITGTPDSGPTRAGVAISDITTGLQLAVGVLVALHERSRTGRGRWVHTSLVESMIGMLDFQAARWTVAGEDPPPQGNDHPTLIPMGTYQTADGLMNVAAPGGRLWNSFCQEAGLEELLQDERFASSKARSENRTELNRLIGARIKEHSVRSWVERLNAVGVPAGPVNTVAQAFEDPQVRHLAMAVPVSHPRAGPINIIRNATQIEGVPNDIRRPSPIKGEHTNMVLAQFGLTEAERDELLARRIVH